MSRIDVSWSPNSTNQFLIVQNNELTLYKLLDRNAAASVAGQHAATILTKNTDVTFVKTSDCHPSLEHEHLVAVGHANGRVLLTSPFLSNSDNWFGREFVPKHNRACLSLAWNPKNSWLLAIGLDRYKADNSIFIWDLTTRPPVSTDSAMSAANIVTEHASQGVLGSDHRRVQSFADYGPGPPSNASGSGHHSRALHELAPSESAVSLAWFRHNPRILLCGLSGKYIKSFDMRDSSKPQSSITTKAVHGLTLDPFSDNRLCSYYDNQIMLWDLRHSDKPLLIVSDQKFVTKIQWDPVRRNVISSLCKDSSTVRVYHLQQIIAGEETEVSFIETYVQPRFESPQQPASFLWHPTDENRVVVVGNNGEICDVSVCESLPIDWNCDGTLLTAFPKYLCEFPFLPSTEQDKKSFLYDDVSYRMKHRAVQGYGAESPQMFRRAMELCKEETDLQWLWGWLEKMKNIASEDTETWLYDVKFPGALTIFRVPFGRGGSSTEYRSIFGLDSAGYSPLTRLYVSPERDRLLQLCGWGSMIKERSSVNDPVIQKLLADGEIERAAAIALFTLRLKLSVQILTNAAATVDSKQNLQLVALSLAGFPGASEKETTYLSSSSGASTGAQTPSLWLELCNSVLANINNPYLKAMFLFLSGKCNSSNTYDGVLELNDFPVYDKIAFAAVHLPDSNVNEVLERLYRQSLSTSNLLGVIICGFGSDECLQLLENYIDLTGDVQSAALLLITTGSFRQPEFAETTDDKSQVVQFHFHKRVDEIIGAYLNLLNRWCLWHVRAQTELPLVKSDDKNGAKPVVPQVYLTCTFCSKSVWSGGSGRPRQRMNKLGSCPSCKKPLPRCSLCRFHMGTPLHDEEYKFGTWFSWCQTCRHGGHAQHLTEWFQEHEECPVTGCSCKCASLDLSNCGNTF